VPQSVTRLPISERCRSVRREATALKPSSPTRVKLKSSIRSWLCVVANCCSPRSETCEPERSNPTSFTEANKHLRPSSLNGKPRNSIANSLSGCNADRMSDSMIPLGFRCSAFNRTKRPSVSDSRTANLFTTAPRCTNTRMAASFRRSFSRRAESSAVIGDSRATLKSTAKICGERRIGRLSESPPHSKRNLWRA